MKEHDPAEFWKRFILMLMKGTLLRVDTISLFYENMASELNSEKYLPRRIFHGRQICRTEVCSQQIFSVFFTTCSFIFADSCFIVIEMSGHFPVFKALPIYFFDKNRFGHIVQPKNLH